MVAEPKGSRQSFAFYGKGGSGKSMIASNLSVCFARRGLRTLQIGCDPKHDSTRALTSGTRIPTIIRILQNLQGQPTTPADYLVRGRHGIGCIEAGGPESGVGCAGLGIVSAFRLIEDDQVLEDFDVVLMDVLGDVVCGGFATPIMKGLASAVVLVASDTLMSMYAANNIARAIHRYQRNGARLAGIVANRLRDPDGVEAVETFASTLGTRILGIIPDEPAIHRAERRAVPVVDDSPEPSLKETFERLAEALLDMDVRRCPPPSPMTDEALEGLFARMFR